MRTHRRKNRENDRSSAGWLVALVATSVGPGCLLDGTPILAGDLEASDGEAEGIPDAGPDRGEDAIRDADGEADGAPDAEAFEEDGDGPDAEAEAEAECVWRAGSPLSLAPSTGATDEYERPVAFGSGSGFAFVGRPPGSVGDGFLLARLRLDGTLVSPPSWLLSGVELSTEHPAIELPDGRIAVAFAIPADVGVGVWLKIVPPTGPSVAPRQVDGTDETCGAPTLTYDGTNVVVVWTDDESAGGVELRGGHFDPETGRASDFPVTLASGPVGTREPRIAWGDDRHALVWFGAADASLHVLGLDRSFARTSEAILPSPSGEDLVGYPALAWNGAEFGLLWETRGAVVSTMHLATFAPDEPPVEREPLAGVALSSAETGEVALAWVPERNEWGIAWRHAHPGRVSISLARVDAEDFTLQGDPIDIHVGETTAWHPAVASNAGVYMVAWVEQATGRFPMYVAAVDCR